MTTWLQIAQRLAAGERLSYDESRDVMHSIMSGALDDIHLASFLSMIAVRGIEVDELAGLADEMQSIAEPIELDRNSVDIVGTGGDGAKTVNISTMAAVVIAAAGVPVVKHGNRASTSGSGSADILEALGVNLEQSVSRIKSVFDSVGIAFLFANKFHPSMRYAARVRRELGFPTVFNVLGPLTNPACPKTSVVGVANADAAPLVAGVFAARGTSAFVFRGMDYGLDEISTVEPSRLWTVRGGKVEESVIDPAAILDLPRASLSDLRGGNPSDNAKNAYAVFSGEQGPVADAVAMNAALGLMGATPGKTPDNFDDDFRAAFVKAKENLQSGAVANKLDQWVEATNES